MVVSWARMRSSLAESVSGSTGPTMVGDAPRLVFDTKLIWRRGLRGVRRGERKSRAA